MGLQLEMLLLGVMVSTYAIKHLPCGAPELRGRKWALQQWVQELMLQAGHQWVDGHKGT